MEGETVDGCVPSLARGESNVLLPREKETAKRNHAVLPKSQDQILVLTALPGPDSGPNRLMCAEFARQRMHALSFYRGKHRLWMYTLREWGGVSTAVEIQGVGKQNIFPSICPLISLLRVRSLPPSLSSRVQLTGSSKSGLPFFSCRGESPSSCGQE